MAWGGREVYGFTVRLQVLAAVGQDHRKQQVGHGVVTHELKAAHIHQFTVAHTHLVGNGFELGPGGGIAEALSSNSFLFTSMPPYSMLYSNGRP